LTKGGAVRHHEGMDAERIRAQVLRAYQEGPEAVVSCVGTLLIALTARLTALEAENARLAARLGTTSHNSGKPPSWDGPGVKPHPKSQRGHRGRASLPRFRGRAVQDGLSSYGQYAQCAHALCNAHHPRELTFVEEQLGQGWAATLTGVLGEGKQVVDAARARGEAGLPAGVCQEIARRYDAALEEGARATPPAPPTGTRGRPKRGKAGNLVDRPRTHEEATLAFLSDTTIPFATNQAERDIRMTKVREKISGCFRTPTGGARVCRIRGDISTLRQQGQPIFAALGQALAGDPLLPLTC